MGFQESETTPSYVTSQVNSWMAEWLRANPPSVKQYGLTVRYVNSEGGYNQELINDNLKLESLYKICRCSAIDILYLLIKIYNGQVKYTDFIYFVTTISNKLKKIKETQQEVKSENERYLRLNQLEMEIRKITAKARETLRVTK